MTRTLICALTAALLALGLTSAPASAAVGVRKDQANPRVSSSLDLREVRYDNGARDLRVRIGVRDLRSEIVTVETRLSTRALRLSGTTYILGAWRSRTGDSSSYLLSETRRGLVVRECNGLRESFNLRTDVISLRMPQRCLSGADGDLRLSTLSGRNIPGKSDRTKPIDVAQG